MPSRSTLTRTATDTQSCRLSITEWRPVTGTLPPRTSEAWDAEFEKYRASPEFKLLNPHMTLEEYKSIYWMEWTHRIWGRLIGVGFVLPFAYFAARGQISTRNIWRIMPIGGLIALQGLLGWWMVRSGLRDDLFAPGSQPRVSQYWLVAHLGTAFLTYSAMLVNGLKIFNDKNHVQWAIRNRNESSRLISVWRKFPYRTVLRSANGLAFLVFCTAMSGGLVAGLDAGLIYNDFPYMGEGRLAPPRSELFSDFYARWADKQDLIWRNMLENPSLVQLEHRLLAGTTFTSIMAFGGWVAWTRLLKPGYLRPLRMALRGVIGISAMQVTLGITTLLYLVPIPLASAHRLMGVGRGMRSLLKRQGEGFKKSGVVRRVRY